ncbi:MAG: alanine--glyoxylate aminotransferase family protein, partial [Ignavibacteria bacterium]|nr:alanine--glyoxylate aminotransferase family protein [Ignavibacteria bacterium]
MKSIVERCDAKPIVVNNPWGSAVDLNLFEDTLKNNKAITVCVFVHAETSTGAKSNIKALTEIAHQHNCLVIADTVTSLGGIPLKIDEWNIDVAYSGSQKCLSCPPGLAPITFNSRAVEFIKNRENIVQSWFMDLNLVLGYWGKGAKRAYHHTAPINSLYALHESLLLLKEEGIENSWSRHQKNGDELVSELEKIGLKPFVKVNERLPQLTSTTIQDGIDDASVRKSLLQKYNIEIGAGLGDLSGKVWRIGLMGYSSNEENINACVRALNELINKN